MGTVSSWVFIYMVYSNRYWTPQWAVSGLTRAACEKMIVDYAPKQSHWYSDAPIGKCVPEPKSM